MKKLINWKVVTLLSVTVTILLLFSVLRNDFLALPDSGMSRGMVLEQLDVPAGYEEYYAQHYVSLEKDNLLYLITTSELGLKVSIYDSLLNLKEEHLFEAFKSFTNMSASFTGETLVLNTYSKASSSIQLFSVDTTKWAITLESEEKLPETRVFVLGPTFQIYEASGALYIKSSGKNQLLDKVSFIETLAYATSANGNLWVGYTDYVDGQYQMNLLELSKDYQVISAKKPYYQFGAGGSNKPHELTMKVVDNRLQSLSVIRDHKAGINTAYWLKSSLSDLSAVDFKLFNAYSYSLFPLIVDKGSNKSELIMSSKTSIGRVEIGSDGNFQNLVILDESLENAKSLTKSTKPSLSPQLLEIDGHRYLTYVQINQGKGRIMVSSDFTPLIELSKKSTLTENLNLLMTTLTTFLPLLYVSMIVEIYVLTPVLVVVILISMFKLTWAERNGRQMLYSALGIHLLTKVYFIWRYIFNGSEVFSNFPGFMDSPLKFLGLAILMTMSSLYALYLYRKEKPTQHYLIYYLVFNLVDILLFTMLYAPYYLLV